MSLLMYGAEVPYHLGKLRLGDTLFQAFDLYIYIKIILYHNAPRFR